MSQRFDQCDTTCTTDCGHCKGQGPPWTAETEAMLRLRIAHDRAARWGYDVTLDPDDARRWYDDEAAQPNTVQDVRSVLAALAAAGLLTSPQMSALRYAVAAWRRLHRNDWRTLVGVERRLWDAAQDARSTLDEASAEMDDMLAAAEKRGYARAVAVLRDEDRYDRWWTKIRADHPDYGYWEFGRRQLAEYLETVERKDHDHG